MSVARIGSSAGAILAGAADEEADLFLRGFSAGLEGSGGAERWYLVVIRV